tara:strand:+ start:602 stop:1264 length:663 start_codon:yes stop_codon:yes gene_type:complete
VSGYVLATQCYFFKFRVARQSGQRLYLTALLLGFFSAFAATALMELFGSLASSEGLPLALLTFTLSVLATYGYNLFVPDAKEKALWAAWQEDDLEKLCGRAITQNKPIAITLNSRKVYVGLIGDTLEPKPKESAYLSLFPLFSGYRDPDTLSFHLIHRYDELLNTEGNHETGTQKEKWLDFLIVIPRSEIVSIHIFNDHLYQHIKQNTQAALDKRISSAR